MGNRKHKMNYHKLNVQNLHNPCFVNTENDCITSYFRDARKYKNITQEEEQDLIRRIKNHDIDSERLKNKLIGSHQAFVVMFAKRHCPYDDGILLDLIQEGNYGMLVALDNFDINSGVKFMTYANTWIIKYMYKFLQENELIQRNNRAKTFGVDKKVREQFIKDYGYEPTSDELLMIFNEMGINLKHKEDLDNISVVSIDSPIMQENYDDDDDSAFDIPIYDETDERIDRGILCANVDKFLGMLPELERKVMEKTFGFHGSVEKDAKLVSEELGLTTGKVIEIFNSAVKKFKQSQKFFE